MIVTWKLRFLTALLVMFILFIILAVAEFIASTMEGESRSNFTHDDHPRLGWVPHTGKSLTINPEFQTTQSINSLNMNDRPISDVDSNFKHRILVLGDSHTFAAGVSTDDTWPNQMEKLLFPDGTVGTVYNAGVIGYNLGQYLERFRLLKNHLNPTLVIIGFSMATDLYDLIPPERGGFIYGGNKERRYFDLSPDGNLITKQYKTSELGIQEYNILQKIKNFLQQFALYRRTKRSKLAMWIAANYHPGGEALWPGLDTALKIRLSEEDAYRWKLAEALMKQLVDEASEQEISVLIVNIPYLAQVYDEVWESSFGTNQEKYDRWIGSKRLESLSGKIGAYYVDTTRDFIESTRKINRWLHYPQDAHPTIEGHALIAKVTAHNIRESGFFTYKIR